MRDKIPLYVSIFRRKTAHLKNGEGKFGIPIDTVSIFRRKTAHLKIRSKPRPRLLRNVSIFRRKTAHLKTEDGGLGSNFRVFQYSEERQLT